MFQSSPFIYFHSLIGRKGRSKIKDDKTWNEMIFCSLILALPFQYNHSYVPINSLHLFPFTQKKEKGRWNREQDACLCLALSFLLFFLFYSRSTYSHRLLSLPSILRLPFLRPVFRLPEWIIKTSIISSSDLFLISLPRDSVFFLFPTIYIFLPVILCRYFHYLAMYIFV